MLEPVVENTADVGNQKQSLVIAAPATLPSYRPVHASIALLVPATVLVNINIYDELRVSVLIRLVKNPEAISFASF